MAKNDKKIKDLLKSIESKKAKLGTKPRAAWRTNGILKYERPMYLNINTVNTTDKCVEALAYLLRERSFLKEAAELLGVKTNVEEVSVTDDYIADFKLRASIVLWDGENHKLDLLEQKLKDLRSEDSKTEEALSDILDALS